MTSNFRRSSIVNIEDWLDKCSNEEPDSIIYDLDYARELAKQRTRQKGDELETLYKDVTDICSKIGLPPEIVDDRLHDIDDCITAFFNTLHKDVNDEYEKLCRYKQELLDEIQKMTSDLHLPAYVPEDNITLLMHCKRLKSEFNKLNSVRECRMQRLKELKDKQLQLCIVLGIRSPEQIKMQTNIPSDEELVTFANVIFDLEREEKRRKEKYRVLKDMISKCTDLLELPNTIHFDQPDYSESNLLKMTELHSKLEAQYAKNQQKYEKLRDRLIRLYNRLEIQGPERDNFLESHSTCKPSVMEEMEVQIDIYEELKKKNIGKFIEKIKSELIVEYERCYQSQEQQDAFLSMSSEPSEELLDLYEKELARLQKYYEDNREILDKFNKWRQMWKELIALEVKENDPNRFNNRGGQLLLEEKKRKAIQKGLPKIEKELMDMNAKLHGFKVFGTNLDEFISGCWDELNQAKEEERRERQRAKMTPNKKNTTIKRSAAGSRLLGPLSLSEQDFEALAVQRPTSAKRATPAKRPVARY